jgi:DNA-binding MarR family transcriptional regulator
MAGTSKSPSGKRGGIGGLGDEIGKRKPFELPEVEAFLNIMRTAGMLESETGRFFKPFALSAPQYNALRILRGHLIDAKDGIPSQTIGEELISQVPDVTRLVDRLVEAGLAERSRTESDRRVVLVRITKAGLDLLTKIDKPLAELHQRQLGHLSKAELAEINRLMVRARKGGPAEGDVKKRCP